MTTDGSGHDGVDRRSLLFGIGGTAGLAALAGCTGEEQPNATNATQSPPSRPSGDVDDEHWRYILDSIEYQNEMLRRIGQEVE